MNKFIQIATWLQWDQDGSFKTMFKAFPEGELGQALNFTTALRRSQYTQEPLRDEDTGELYGTDISHITITGDTPGNVTKMGVSGPPPDYNWKKRRP